MLTLDGEHAYWVSRNGTGVRRAPLAGGMVVTLAEPIAAPEFQLMTTDCVVDATHVYWIGARGPTAAIHRVAKSGGAVANVATDPGQPMGITADATHVYWTSWAAGFVGNVNRALK